MTFEVKEIEFESCSEWEKASMHDIIDKFTEYGEKYIPTLMSIIKVDCKKEKTILRFEKSISLNTICNILSKMSKNNSSIEFEEIEYKPYKVEVEVK